MKIHKEGYRIIAATFSMLVVSNLSLYLIWGYHPNIQWASGIASFIFFAFVVRFFRFPKREMVCCDNSVISPADGKVVAIEEVDDKEYFRDRRLQVSIFMSAFNVHINWLPISGKVKYFRYHPGKYLVAFNPKSSELNERATTVIEHSPETEILVRQIAGAVARRIVTYPKTQGFEVKQGSQLGFIKFGSRVDILLPLNSMVKVKLNQRVTGLKSIIAELP